MLVHGRQKAVFLSLVGLLFVGGVLELTGMVVLFGFVRGLQVDEGSGQRLGPLGKLLESIHGERLEQMEFVVFGGAFVVGFMLVKNFQGTFARFALNRFLTRVNRKISEQLYRTFMLAPYELLRRRGVASQTKKVKETFQLYNRCFFETVQIIADGLILLMVIALLLFIDYRMTLFAILFFGSVAAGLHLLMQRNLTRIATVSREAQGRVNRFVREGLDGIVEIRLRGAGRYFFSEYSRALGRSAVMQRRQNAITRLPRSANEVALAGMIVGATLLVTLQGDSVEEALPQLSVFGFAGLRILGVIGRLNGSAQTLRRQIGAFEKSQGMLSVILPEAVGLPQKKRKDYLQEERALPAGVDGRLHEKIELSGVRFRYHKAEVDAVAPLSLSIHRGQNVAICGPSGGGKSTLLLILMGIMKPTKGKVTCDGWSVHEHIQAWHSNIGYVGQSPFLVGRTVRENVGFGIEPEQIDDEKVWRALSLASAADFVRELPGELDSVVGEGGTRLSGGQRQRLVLARALYEEPDILILDEATAALDNNTEREVTRAINKLTGRMTVVSVAHRLSSIRDCDEIFFLSAGKLVAQGTFDELLANCDEFREMAEPTVSENQ